MVIDLLFALVLGLALWTQLHRFRRREATARATTGSGDGPPARPQAQHPQIDAGRCIGCGACVDACPEGEVLAVMAGKAALVEPERCIGHGLCAEACPVGAIDIVLAPPSVSADTPLLSLELETNVPNLFVAGELGGLALIKNAVNQGRECVDVLARRLRGRRAADSIADVCIIGAGPAGLSASMRAHEHGLSYVTLEQEEVGGSVARYPRQKLVMTSPFELPLYGKFKKLEITKEALLALWTRVVHEQRLHVRNGERVEHVGRDPDGVFAIDTPRGGHRARSIILAIGRRGAPRKLGVPGEELPKVMYSLVDAASYQGKRILVVGGGDSAIEAALGLAHQGSNRVTLSYRRASFTRLKRRNDERIHDAIRRGGLDVVFHSQSVEVRPASAVLEVAGRRRELPNDFVWVFAGGTPPPPSSSGSAYRSARERCRRHSEPPQRSYCGIVGPDPEPLA